MDESGAPIAANSLTILTFGLKISIQNSTNIGFQTLKQRVFTILPNCQDFSDEDCDADFIFEISSDGELYQLSVGGEKIISPDSEERLLDHLEKNLRVTVAEYAVDRVFLHAGVVSWNGSAIIIPAKSFQGKTTLVSELVRCGAVYYSDEYAVLDQNGNVEPFPKMLSMRGIKDAFTQVDLAVENFGGIKGVDPVPVGMVLLTEFEKQAKWNPEALTPGQGIMELLPHTFPIRLNPKFTLNILNKMVSRAIIVKTSRGEAKQFAEIILKFFEKQQSSTTLKN